MAHSQQDQEATKLSTEHFESNTDKFVGLVQEVVSQVCSHSNVSKVFGEPVTRDDVTIIPVASVIAGFGAGAGAGAGKKPQNDAGQGGGMGVGGGFIMQPWGVWEIRQGEVRFRRAEPQGLRSTLFELISSIVRRRRKQHDR